MILLIDNYDSFVHNLARYLRRLGQETLVLRNDEITPAQVWQEKPDAIVLSPGPGTPQQAGCCLDVVRQLHSFFPILGVCLGHQVIAEAFGGRVVRGREPVHGRSSLMTHNGTGEFQELPASFLVGRYHSLVICPDSLPDCLMATATLDDGTIMGVRHRNLPVVGWQFHPESVLTQHGYRLLSCFLAEAGIDKTGQTCPETELMSAMPTPPDWFERAIEFPGS